MDLTVEGKLYHHGVFGQGCLSIQDGKIIDIKKTLHSENHLNVGTKLILPTGIDIHVHFRDPGMTHKEDFTTGSLAAAYGGISCVCDMPNTQPSTTSVQTLKEKRQLAGKKSVVDFGLYAAISDENVERVADMAPLCTGFKIFLGSSTLSPQVSAQNLHVALLEANRTRKITLIHAEDDHCLQIHQDREDSLIDHLRCRTAECEETAIKNIISSSHNLTSPIHICHLSSSDGFEVLRQRPLHISVGVTPHHLFFDVQSIRSHHTWYKVNPPLRSTVDRESLWYGVNHGLIDIFESDHAPHTEEEKNVSFHDAPAGLPGVETMYPLLLAALKKEQITLDRLLLMMCERPAQLLGLSKGALEIGRDADFIVVDLKKTETITAARLHSKCGWTPFEGRPGIFPSLVFIRGERVIDDHQLLVRQGFGTYLGE
jgi:dihydroorotase